MDIKMISKFKGTINDVEFNNENTFYSVEFLLHKIEDKYGTCYNDKFIEDLRDTIDVMNYKYEEFSYSELEREFYEDIENSSKFNEIAFSYYGSDWKIEELNKSIAENEYDIWEIKKENKYTEIER